MDIARRRTCSAAPASSRASTCGCAGRRAWHGAARARLPAGVRAAGAGDAAQRVSNLSRAYRVNLTVLALVALFTGAFLVFSVLSLERGPARAAVRAARRAGPDGARAAAAGAGRVRAAGRSSAALLGIALGTALAALALRAAGRRPGRRLLPRRGAAAAMEHAGRAGLRRARRGRRAGRRLAARARGGAAAAGADPQGPGQRPAARARRPAGSACCAARRRRALALLPPVSGIPLAAYLSVGLLLVGGITALPVARRAAVRPARAAAWRTGCCRCWRWSARAACARAPRSPSAAWWRRSAWRWR